MSRPKRSILLSGPIQTYIFHNDVAAEIAALGEERLRMAELAIKMDATVSPTPRPKRLKRSIIA